MRIFGCRACGQLVYFENTVCTRCRHLLGFEPAAMALVTLEAADGEGVHRVHGEPGRRLRYCANAVHDACNWLVPAESGRALCPSCRLNRTIPDLAAAGSLPLWQRIEAAKRRLVYALLRFDLPLTSHGEDGNRALAFDFLAETEGSGQVMTGHADGLVTINIAEADPAERERRRMELGEPYRTLLGHLRHEVGHYYWDVLVRDGGRLDAARALFGDETADYAASIERHYAEGAPPDWQEHHVSAYATMHPWEDFAETWTHYLHIVDTLDTAASFGLGIDPAVTDDPALRTRIGFDPYRSSDLGQIIAAWLPLTYAVNSLNRSMGQPDLYPFVLPEPVIAKLGFIQRLIHGARG